MCTSCKFPLQMLQGSAKFLYSFTQKSLISSPPDQNFLWESSLFHEILVPNHINAIREETVGRHEIPGLYKFHDKSRVDHKVDRIPSSVGSAVSSVLASEKRPSSVPCVAIRFADESSHEATRGGQLTARLRRIYGPFASPRTHVIRHVSPHGRISA